jgi:hypothetical protein
MHSEPTLAPPGSPAAGAPHVVRAATEAASGPPAPASSLGGHRPVRFALRKVMSVLRGDKYMVGAYPPDPTTTGAAAVSATPSKAR